MKFILLAIIFCGSAMAAEPHITTAQKKLRRDGHDLQEVSRNVIFPDGKFIYKTLNIEGENNIYQKKWGDFFFGLEFGRGARTNGGWGLWSFLKLNFRDAHPVPNALSRYLPETLSMIALPEQAIVDFKFRMDEKGHDISMRAIQFNSHPAWIFFRIDLGNASAPLLNMELTAAPANTGIIAERERWASTCEGNYNLSQQTNILIPRIGNLILYNKYLNEDAGNMIVFQAADFRQIIIPETKASVAMRFQPQPDIRRIIFGVSYFLNRSQGDTLQRFLGEDADAIRGFMQTIDWNPRLDTAEYEKLKSKCLRILGKLRNASALTSELKQLDAQTQNAIKDNDLPRVAALLVQWRALNEKIAESGLNEFK